MPRRVPLPTPLSARLAGAFRFAAWWVVLTGGLVFRAGAPAAAQTLHTLRGQVVDSLSRAPLPFATVALCGRNVAVNTGESGTFVLHYSGGPADTLCVSFIGYQPYRLALPPGPQTAPVLVLLQPATYQLALASVYAKPPKPKKIVSRAIRAIPGNFPARPYLMHGYYRDFLRTDGNKPLAFLEAAVVIQDFGFGVSDRKSRVRVEQVRFDSSTYSLKNDGSVILLPGFTLPPQGNNELNILRVHDPIRNHATASFSFIDVFARDFIPNHTFGMDSLTYLEGEPVYCIRLGAAHGGGAQKYRVQGRLYVRVRDYAIARLQYAVYGDFKTLKGKLYELTVEYKPYQQRMYLNYLSFSNLFLRQQGDQIAFFYQYREFFVHGLDTGPFKPLPDNDPNAGQPLWKQPIPADTAFWDRYNRPYIRSLFE